MPAFLSPIFGAGVQLFDSKGLPLAGGLINTYVAGSVSTPLDTWNAPDQLVKNSNPIVLDSAGRCNTEIWLAFGTSVKLFVTDAFGGATGPSWDNISGVGDTSGLVTTATFSSGSFTPTLKFGGAIQGGTYATQTGWYSYVNGVVTFFLQVRRVGSGSGQVTISGLPKVPDTTKFYSFSVGTFNLGTPVAGTTQYLSTLAGADIGVFYTTAAAANPTAVDAAAFNSGSPGSGFSISGSYKSP